MTLSAANAKTVTVNDATADDAASAVLQVTLRNDGAGHFVSVAPSAVPLPAHYAVAVAVADLNEDGFPDVVVACAGQDRVLLNSGSGLLTDATASRAA